MSSKISNIIAIELAILIGIMSWMAYFLYSHLSSAQRTMTEVRENAVSPLANQRPYTLYYPGRDRAPSRSAEIPQGDDQDYGDVASEPASTYMASAQNVAYQQPVEPVVYQAEPDQTAAYEEPQQAVVYQEPAPVYYQEPAYFVVYSNPYRFVNRFRSRRHCASVTATHRFPDRIGPHQQNHCEPIPQEQNIANVSRVEQRENVAWIESRGNRNMSSGRSAQGFRREGIVRQASGDRSLRSRP